MEEPSRQREGETSPNAGTWHVVHCATQKFQGLERLVLHPEGTWVGQGVGFSAGSLWPQMTWFFTPLGHAVIILLSPRNVPFFS